jgi:hypothetical protein
MAARNDWIVPLAPADFDEIRHALQVWKARPDAGPAPLAPADFPLPSLGARLLSVRRELLNGRGFVLLKGMPVFDWSREDCAMAFIGLGAHLGRARSQNAAGHLLGHVRDVGLASTDPNVRIYQTPERQTFHTDSCDVVGLLCLREAKAGNVLGNFDDARFDQDGVKARGRVTATVSIGSRPSADDAAEALLGKSIVGLGATVAEALSLLTRVARNKMVTDPATGTLKVYADVMWVLHKALAQPNPKPIRVPTMRCTSLRRVAP